MEVTPREVVHMGWELHGTNVGDYIKVAGVSSPGHIDVVWEFCSHLQ